MKKVTIKGVDGKEIPAYVCSDHPANFPTDMTGHKVEEVDLNNLSEMDVNENSAGCGAHEEAMPKKKCCGGGCHDGEKGKKGTKGEFPTTLSWNASKEMIKDFVKKAKEANKELDDIDITSIGVVPSPLDVPFNYGLYDLGANLTPPNKLKVKLDDTIPSDLLETKDLKLGKLYRVAGVDLVARFVAQIMIPEQKTLIQIKHHGNLLYVEEKSLIRASNEDVKNYLNQPF